jgi:hypothetical protein
MIYDKTKVDPKATFIKRADKKSPGNRSKFKTPDVVTQFK